MTERKDTDLARRRRQAREIKTDVAEAAAVVGPTAAYVQPALAAVLSTAQHVIAQEVAFMARDQQSGVRMDSSTAKALQSLMASLNTAVTLERQANEAHMDELTDAQLEAALLDELQQLRDKRGG